MCCRSRAAREPLETRSRAARELLESRDARPTPLTLLAVHIHEVRLLLPTARRPPHREAAQHDASARASAPAQHCAARAFLLCTLHIGATCSPQCTFAQPFAARRARIHAHRDRDAASHTSQRPRENAPMHTAQHLSAMVPVQRSDVNSPLLCSHRVAPQMIADDVLCGLESGCRRSPLNIERRYERSKTLARSIDTAARALKEVTNSPGIASPRSPPPPLITVAATISTAATPTAVQPVAHAAITIATIATAISDYGAQPYGCGLPCLRGGGGQGSGPVSEWKEVGDVWFHRRHPDCPVLMPSELSKKARIIRLCRALKKMDAACKKVEPVGLNSKAAEQPTQPLAMRSCAEHVELQAEMVALKRQAAEHPSQPRWTVLHRARFRKLPRFLASSEKLQVQAGRILDQMSELETCVAEYADLYLPSLRRRLDFISRQRTLEGIKALGCDAATHRDVPSEGSSSGGERWSAMVGDDGRRGMWRRRSAR